MPNTTSAKKRLRQNLIRRTRNRSFKSAVRTQVGKVESALNSSNLDEAEKEFRVAARQLDQAAGRGVIHSNAASRKKSRLQHRIRKAKSAAAG
jgi:small subunit ribosomal protein S20